MKFFCAAFISLQFGFVIFWQKDFGAKAAHQMLVKLTPGRWFSLPRKAAKEVAGPGAHQDNCRES
jgi:hypothetical protein